VDLLTSAHNNNVVTIHVRLWLLIRRRSLRIKTVSAMNDGGTGRSALEGGIPASGIQWLLRITLRHGQGVNHCTGAKTMYATLVLTRSALSVGFETCAPVATWFQSRPFVHYSVGFSIKSFNSMLQVGQDMAAVAIARGI
jgi:hypothetical protein